MRIFIFSIFVILSAFSSLKAQDPADNWNETFHDVLDDIYWTNQLAVDLSYRQALEVCASLNQRGAGNGWRLPGTVEFQSLHKLATGQRGQWKRLKSDINLDGCVDRVDRDLIVIGTPYPSPCRGDFNEDLLVDQRDISIWEAEQGSGCNSSSQGAHTYDINGDGFVSFADQSRAILFQGQSNVTFCEGDLNRDGVITDQEIDNISLHIGECAGINHNCKNRGETSAACGTTFLSNAACPSNPNLWILSSADEEFIPATTFNLAAGTEIILHLNHLSGLRCVRRGDGGLPELPKRTAWKVVPGDSNRDGSVDLQDLNDVRNNFGAIGESIIGDGNQDGVVNLGDLNDVRNNFGYILAPPELPYFRGDTNCDRKFDNSDLEGMNLVISDRAEHLRRFPHCNDDYIGDMNCDGYYNEDDLFYLELALEDEEYYERNQVDCGVLVGRN